MKVIDPGHLFRLDTLDGSEQAILRFVKRIGVGYPGNETAYCGTVLQEVFRACISRLFYLNTQIPCLESQVAITHVRAALYLMEARNARLKGLPMPENLHALEQRVTCTKCLHIVCNGHEMESAK